MNLDLDLDVKLGTKRKNSWRWNAAKELLDKFGKPINFEECLTRMPTHNPLPDSVLAKPVPVRPPKHGRPNLVFKRKRIGREAGEEII